MKKTRYKLSNLLKITHLAPQGQQDDLGLEDFQDPMQSVQLMREPDMRGQPPQEPRLSSQCCTELSLHTLSTKHSIK